MSYVRRGASDLHIKMIITLYAERYHVEITHLESKNLLEGVMQFVYMTEVLNRLDPEIVPTQETPSSIPNKTKRRSVKSI